MRCLHLCPVSLPRFVDIDTAGWYSSIVDFLAVFLGCFGRCRIIFWHTRGWTSKAHFCRETSLHTQHRSSGERSITPLLSSPGFGAIGYRLHFSGVVKGLSRIRWIRDGNLMWMEYIFFGRFVFVSHEIHTQTHTQHTHTGILTFVVLPKPLVFLFLVQFSLLWPFGVLRAPSCFITPYGTTTVEYHTGLPPERSLMLAALMMHASVREAGFVYWKAVYYRTCDLSSITIVVLLYCTDYYNTINMILLIQLLYYYYNTVVLLCLRESFCGIEACVTSVRRRGTLLQIQNLLLSTVVAAPRPSMCPFCFAFGSFQQNVTVRWSDRSLLL